MVILECILKNNLYNSAAYFETAFFPIINNLLLARKIQNISLVKGHVVLIYLINK